MRAGLVGRPRATHNRINSPSASNGQYHGPRYQDLLACCGFPFRFVDAMSCNSFSDIESAMERDAPCRSLLLVSPRFADNAAPAAFCCAFDFAGMVQAPYSVGLPPVTGM